MTYPVPTNRDPDADSISWWLRHLINELLTRQPYLELRENYVAGRHELPKGDRRYMRALRHLQRLASSNYYGLVTTAPVERMMVRGFRFGEAGTADEDATSIWQYNDMDLQSDVIHQMASTYGMAYALVTPPDDGEEWPTITAEDPRIAIVKMDPSRKTRALAGLRMWIDDVSGYVLAALYMPEGCYLFQGPPSFDLQGLSIETMIDRLTNNYLGNGESAFEQYDFFPNPPDCQKVALVEYIWKPGSGTHLLPEGEAGVASKIIQDRINQRIFDQLCITHFQAYKQRWVSGVKPTTDRNNRKKAPFDPGADTLFVTANEKAKFGEFTSADITQILEAVRDDIADMAAITKTPAHYLMGKMANISGETLTQAESGLVSKTQLRMKSMGWSHERVMKLCFAYLGDSAKAEDYNAETLWSDPQKQITAELALAGQQWAAVGIPLELIMERQGFTPDEITFAVAKKAEADQQALEQQQMAMQQQHSNAMEMATATGKTQASTTKPGATGSSPPKQSAPTKPAQASQGAPPPK